MVVGGEEFAPCTPCNTVSQFVMVRVPIGPNDLAPGIYHFWIEPAFGRIPIKNWYNLSSGQAASWSWVLLA